VALSALGILLPLVPHLVLLLDQLMVNNHLPKAAHKLKLLVALVMVANESGQCAPAVLMRLIFLFLLVVEKEARFFDALV
jgi:hypothetical protein